MAGPLTIRRARPQPGLHPPFDLRLAQDVREGLGKPLVSRIDAAFLQE